MNRIKFWRHTNFTLLIVGVIVAVLLVNLLVGQLFGGLKLDLTREGYFSLSDTTRDLLNRIDVPVEIAVLSEESATDPRLNELFSLYRDTGKTVTLSYVDPVRNPAYAQKLPSDVANRLQNGSVWVTAEGRYRVLSPAELISYNNLGELQSVNAEQRLTSAISYVVEPSTDIVTFIGGIATDSMVSLFENENYNVTFMDSLRVGALDENTKALIYIAPQNDLSEEEVATLEDFLSRGGRVAFFLGNDSPAGNKNFNEFLYKWNIRPHRNTVLDLQNCINQNPYYILGLTDASLTEGANNGSVLMLPQAQTLGILADQANNYVDTEVLATTCDTAMSATASGALDIILCSKKYYSTETVGKVLVSGSYLMLHDDVMSDSAYSNGSFMNNLMRDLLDRKESVNIPHKVSETNTVTITNTAFWVLTVLVILVIPAPIALWGILSYRKRRYL